MSKTLDSIRVAIRVRPLLKRENGCKINWQVEENTIFQLNDGKRVSNGAFTFDRIFDKDMATVDVYMDFAKPIVLSVMEGINGTLFAYGQTSSGKTYTMTGDENCPGIIPYALGEIFDYISGTENREFLLRVSYMEIYNEVITDLLKPKHTNLKIHENTQKEVFVGDLTEKLVTSVEEIINLMKIGERNRHFGCTNMNEKSSRSHTIFKMVIESRETSRHSMDGGEVDGAVKVSQLNLVDLAGSERASVTGAEGIRLREGGFINKSLFALGNVINKLSEGESTFVPFRDSKLTRILQTSLGGNAKTSIICAITPASTDETLSTLQFASRAKTIKNRPEVNEVLDETTLLKRYRREINELKKQLEQFANKESMMELQMEKDKMEQLLLEQRKVAAEQQEKMRELANFFCTAQSKEVEKQPKRNKRRWTVCPMGALSKPPLPFDLTSSFDHELINSNKRIKANRSSSSSSSPDSINSPDFNQNNLDRFLADIGEKEEEVEEMPDNVNISRRSWRSSGSLGLTNDTSQEKRSSLPESIAEERIAELELEVKRLAEERDALSEERDAIRNDLSENITSSCEIQEDLLNTKQMLKEKKQQNRELQGRLEQLEASRNSFPNKENDGKQILELKESLANEREMRTVTEATLSDICLAKENVQKELAKSKDVNDALTAELQAVVAAKEEAMTECQRLQKITQELESKVDLLTVVQGDLEAVDELQEELNLEQEKNTALQEEVRKNKEDYLKLRDELQQQRKNCTGLQHSVEVQETGLSQTNEKYEEMVKKLQMLDEENIQLRLQIEELGARETCEGSNAVPVEQRVRDLADENASLNRYNRELKEEYDVLQKELAENSALVLDVKPSTNECSKSFQEIVNEKDVEISSLKEKIEHLTQKLSKRRRRASYHSSEHFTALSVQTYSNVESNPNLISLLNELETKVGMQEKECEFKEAQNIINQMKNNLMQEDDKSELKADKRISQFEDGVLLVESEDSRVIEGLKARNSQLVHEIKDLKRELEGKCSIIGDVEVKSAEITGFLGVDLGEKGPNSLPGKNSELKKKIEVLEGKLKVSSESNKMLEEKLNKATTALEELKQEYQNKVDSLRKDLHEQLERHKCDMDEKLFQINELEMKLKEDLTTQELSLCERDIDSDQFEERSSHMLEMAATLERKSKTINKLQEQLHEVLSSRDTLVSEHEAYVASLQDNTNKELEERDTTIEEKCRTIEEMRKQLQQALSRNEALVEDYESHITRLQHEFRAELLMNTTSLEEKSRVLNELGEKMQRALSSKETLPVGRENGECASVGFTGIPFEEAETQIASQKDEASSLDDLNNQLSSLTSGKCDFSTELETNDFEIEEKSNFIAEPREQLKQAISTGEDAKLEKLKTKKVVKFKEPLQEDMLREETISKEEAILKTEELILILRERGRKYTEVEGKVSDVDKMKEVVEPTTYHCESSLRDPGNQGCVVDLKNELNKDLEKKSKELEEILRENAKLRKQLDHTLSGGQVSLQEHEEHIANLRRNFDEELKRKNKELQAKSNEIDRLNERLEQELIENESANVKHDFAYIQTALEDGLEKNTRKREETSETVNQLEDPLKTISSKQQSPDYHEGLVAALVMEFRKELDRENVKLGNGIAVLQEELQQAISSEEAMPNDWKDYIDRPHEKFDKDLEKRKSEVEENQSRCNNFEEKLKEAIWSEQVMVEDNDTYIAGLKEFGEELHGIHSTAEEKFNLVRELERKLQDAIAGNDLLKENVNQLASLRKELDKVLQVKNDVIAEKSALITNLHEQIENLMTAKKELVDHHETYITSLREEFNEEFERINGILTDKSTLCSNLEDEIKKTKSDQDALLSDHEALVTELKRELNEELERSKAITEEKSTMVLKLEERIINKETEYEESILNNEGLRRKIEALDLEAQKITADLEQKTSQISNLDSELAKTMEAKDTLAEERVSLLSKCQTLEKELSKIRLEFETQSDNLLALEKKANDADRVIHALSQENDSKLDDLSKKNERLKEECQRLEGQVQELSGQKVEVVEKDERIAQLTKDIEQLTKESVSVSQGKMSCENCFGNGNERKKRESLLFKMMLEDIKEHVSCGKGDVNQNDLIDELNHTLIITQERLEQKEFVIDEKEIEILEKDATIKIFKEELQKSRELAAAQETKSAEWNDKLEQHCKETEDWKVKLEKAEVALEKASEESKEVARQLRYERDTLQGKLEEYESIFSEEQLKELYHSMEEKDKRISELERELSDTSKKDHRISEMEMELEVLQSEVSSWKRTTEEAQISLQDSKDIIKEQEERIVELESSKSSAAVKDVEKAGMELQDLRQELEAAKLRLEDLENEKNSGQKLLQEKNQYLEECDDVIDMLKEDLDEKFEELKETSARLQESLQETKEKEAQAIKAAEELKTTKTELGDIQKAHQTISNEYDCAMKQLSENSALIEKLRKQRSEAEEVCKEELQERFRMEKIINELEAENEEFKKKIEELEAQKSCRNPSGNEQQTEMEKKRAEWEAKEQEMVKMKEQIEFLTGYVDVRNEDYKELKNVIQEMEDEMDGLKNQIENLKLEKKSLQKCVMEMEAEMASLQQQSRETTALKSQVEALEAELARVRSSSTVDLEEELKKVRKELKSKELDLYHAEYEKTKQIDSAKSKIRALEKDCANYAKKNNELKTEIRKLRTHDDEPTTEIMNSRQPSSRSGDCVGVIGSVALFTLDAKVAKLQDENEKLKTKSDTLQKKNDTLNIINLDLKQKYGEISEKYKRLKEQFVKSAEASKSKDYPKLPEQRPAEAIQESKNQDSQLLFSTHAWVAPLAKESQGVEKPKTKPITFRENKENLLHQEKPDACKTQ